MPAGLVEPVARAHERPVPVEQDPVERVDVDLDPGPEAREADDPATRLDPLEQVLVGDPVPDGLEGRRDPGRGCRQAIRPAGQATSAIASSTTEFVMRICSLAARNRPWRSASVVISQPIRMPGSPSAFDSDDTPMTRSDE